MYIEFYFIKLFVFIKLVLKFDSELKNRQQNDRFPHLTLWQYITNVSKQKTLLADIDNSQPNDIVRSQLVYVVIL